MARRTTSLSKRRIAAGKTAPAKVSEQTAVKTSRRGKQARLPEMPPGEMSVADAFFPGGEDVAASVTDPEPNELAKARRGRKPKVQPAPEPLIAESQPAHEVSSPARDIKSGPGDEGSNTVADNTATPSASPRRKRRGGQNQIDVQRPASTDISAAAPATQPSAASWNADTGAATFDWPGIEQVAATEGPNQAMAKLLLAARAEGANSRWPF